MEDSSLVGIITIHGICNYGSVLQAYALQKEIESLGYNCKIINYQYPNDFHLKGMKKNKDTYAHSTPNIKERIINKIYQLIDKDKYQILIKKKFKHFRDTYLNQTITYPTYESIKSCDKFDIYISGSDQIWNPRYCFGDINYFLGWITDKNIKKIAYSSSFGTRTIDDLYKKLIIPYLQQYNCIGIRENSGINILKSMGILNGKLVCDPTLLLTAQAWSHFITKPIIKDDYILCYILSYTFNPYPYTDYFIDHIEQRLKTKLVFIDGKNTNRIKQNRIVLKDVGPIEFINLIYFSQLIITTSFHGTAFAINFNKSFYSIIENNDKDERITSLLKITGLEDRIVRIGDKHPVEPFITEAKSTEAQNKLKKFREESIVYLKQALSK